MTDLRRCPECGAEIPGEADALCPKCLLQAGLLSGTTPGADSAAAVAPTSTPPLVDPNVQPTVRSPAPGNGFVPPAPAELAPLFPQLEILELLGKGGMGAVYKARQPGLDRFVAVKILPPEVAGDPAFADRFGREARALARLSHPNIVAIFDSGRTGDLYYFVMEYVDGTNLRQVLEAGKLAPAQALTIIPQICEALQYAHDEGIVHRDIKPENILLDRRGRVRIADFGLAKLVTGTEEALPILSLTGTHQVMGTLRYMAPEQMQGSKQVDHRADIYSLGVVFYELLTGEIPMGRFAPPSKKVQIDVRLDEVVLRALEQEPAQRWQQASEVKSEVESISSSTDPPPIGRPGPKTAQQRDEIERRVVNLWPNKHAAIAAYRRLTGLSEGEASRAVELIAAMHGLHDAHRARSNRPLITAAACALLVGILWGVNGSTFAENLNRLLTVTLPVTAIAGALLLWLAWPASTPNPPAATARRFGRWVWTGLFFAISLVGLIAHNLPYLYVEKPAVQPFVAFWIFLIANASLLVATIIGSIREWQLAEMSVEQRIRRTALGLVVIGSLSLAMCLAGFLFAGIVLATGNLTERDMPVFIGILVTSLVGLISRGVGIAGVLPLLRLERRTGGVIACLLMALPTDPFAFASIPLGISLLLTLLREDTAQAFAARETGAAPAAVDSARSQRPATWAAWWLSLPWLVRQMVRVLCGLVYLSGLCAFFGFWTTSTETPAGREFLFEMGAFSPWYRYTSGQAGVHSNIYFASWSLLVAALGLGALWLDRLISTWERQPRESLRWHVAAWIFLTALVAVVGALSGWSSWSASRTSSPAGDGASPDFTTPHLGPLATLLFGGGLGLLCAAATSWAAASSLRRWSNSGGSRREKVRRLLLGPATGLIGVGLLGMIFNIGAVALFAFVLFFGAPDPEISTTSLVAPTLFFLTMAGLRLAALVAGFRMLGVQGRTGGIGAGVVSLLPFDPLAALSIPIGVWTLWVLGEQEVIDEMSQPAPERAVTADEVRSAGNWLTAAGIVIMVAWIPFLLLTASLGEAFWVRIASLQMFYAYTQVCILWSLVAGAIVTRAGMNLRNGQPGWSRAGAVLAMIPVSPAVLLGFPVGVGVWRLLGRPGLQEALPTPPAVAPGRLLPALGYSAGVLVGTLRRGGSWMLLVGWTGLCLVLYAWLWLPTYDLGWYGSRLGVLDRYYWPYRGSADCAVVLIPQTQTFRRLIVRNRREISRNGFDAPLSMSYPRWQGWGDRDERTRDEFEVQVVTDDGRTAPPLTIDAQNGLTWKYTDAEGRVQTSAFPFDLEVGQDWMRTVVPPNSPPQAVRAQTRAWVELILVLSHHTRQVVQWQAPRQPVGYLEYQVAQDHPIGRYERGEPGNDSVWSDHVGTLDLTYGPVVPILWVGAPVMLAIWGAGVYRLRRTRVVRPGSQDRSSIRLP